jgi:outer membrane protein assembly factor BamA
MRFGVGGMPSGSGFVFGLGNLAGRHSEVARFDVSGQISTKSFKRVRAEVDLPGPALVFPVKLNVLGQYRDYVDLRFYGLGPDSDVGARAHYQLEARDLGVTVDYEQDRSRVTTGVRASILNASIGPGDSDPSLEDLFEPATVPGFDDRSEWRAYGGHVEIDMLDRGYPRLGTVVRLDIEHFDDRRGDAYQFTRWAAEVKGYVPLGPRSRRLALRLRTSSSLPDKGGQVPFFLMETIGGARSIRGYKEYRFRDLRNLLLNVEYRWEIWTFADAVFFLDAGKVFSDRGDLGFSNMETGAGTGLRFHAPGGGALAFNIAWSDETWAIHIGSGPRF